MEGKRVFVTVGTTKFDELIKVASSEEVLDSLLSLGYTSVQYQIGSGKSNVGTHETVKLSYHKFFENFDAEIENADLVISHAGAGTCLQVLRKRKPLIVVINENLMDNHQTELADQLQRNGFLYYCTCDTLKDALTKDFEVLKKYPNPQPKIFANYLDKCMGFDE